MRKIAIVVIMLLLSVMVVSAQDKYAVKVKWTSLAEGLNIAEDQKKPLLVDFGVVKGCPRCAFLQKNVYSNDEIVNKINTEFVPVFIDLGKKLTTEEKALGDKYDFKNDCMLLFLDYKGNVIKDPQGKTLCFMDKVEPSAYIEYLDYVQKHYAP